MDGEFRRQTKHQQNTTCQEICDGITRRVDAAGEYLHNLVRDDLEKFQKGEWLGVVRDMARDKLE